MIAPIDHGSVNTDTLARAEREERDAHIAPLGPEGARRAVEDNARRWAEMYDKQADDLSAQIVEVRNKADWWHSVADVVAANPTGQETQ